MNKSYLYIFVCVLLMGIGASWVINLANESHDIPIIKKVPNFNFINQNGESFSDNHLKGKITVLDFFFTNCPGPCPIMTYNMKSLYDDFSNSEEVQFVSITVDPKNDNIEVLKNYAKINGITDERWQLLTSDLSNIKSLKRGGFMLFADELPQGHAIKFILIDDNQNIRKYFDGTDEASLTILKKDISNLVRELKRYEKRT
tara:strand:- start:479 stop:1081 length:603 start_codon:yes stop_codon:yes gene_type:complete